MGEGTKLYSKTCVPQAKISTIKPFQRWVLTSLVLFGTTLSHSVTRNGIFSFLFKVLMSSVNNLVYKTYEHLPNLEIRV